MFKKIVVGTDGSDTASQAVRQAVDIARALGAELELVSAYEPVPRQRLDAERRQAPEDLQWAISPREEVDGVLEAAAELGHQADIAVRTMLVRAILRTRFSTLPRSRRPISSSSATRE